MSATVRPALPDDEDAILEVILPIIRAGETYALAMDMNANDALGYWTAPSKKTFVAVDRERVIGTYYLTPNHAGGGAHVCNCGFMVSADAGGKGVARAMCEHALETARKEGFRAMQFNFVVSTNVRAIALWERMGFEKVGRLPRAFHHPSEGLVDAFVMYQEL